MMRTAIVGTLAVLALPILSACGRIEPVQDGVPPHPTSVENEDAVLSVEPGAVGACEGQRVAARIAWKVKDPAVQSVLVQVRGDDGGRKVFASGAAQGEAETGQWVAGGTRFHLVDADSRRDLAAFEVAGLACLGPTDGAME